MRFQIDIACDSAAFTNEDGDYDYSNPSDEIKAVLERATLKVEHFSLMGMFDVRLPLIDTNGNAVGFMRYYDAPPGPGNGSDGMSCPQWDEARQDRCAGLLYEREPAPAKHKAGSMIWACNDCDYEIIRIP